MPKVDWRSSAPVPQLPQLPDDDELILACKQQHPRNNHDRSVKWLVYPSSSSPLAFIKFAHKRFGMAAETRNQIFASKALKQMPPRECAGIRIPEVYRVIEKDDIIYLVMEYVSGETLEELLAKDVSDDYLQEKYAQITKAIKLLLSINVPQNTVPGPVGGGIIKHPLFKDTVASIEYASVEELQRHLKLVSLSHKLTSS